MSYIALALVVALVSVLVAVRRSRRPSLKSSPAASVRPASAPALPSSADLAGKVAIVTGGGTGLGRSISLSLARRGARVVVASRNPDHLNAVAAEISALGGECMVFPLDVRKPEQVQEMVNRTVERFGRIDILVNNAAGNFLVPAEELTVNGWNAVIGIVLNGTWYCTSAVGKQMIKQGGGAMLNIVANYAWSGQPGVVHSCSAKAGVLAMTRTLAVEWGRHNIRVNAFAPGAMVTEGASSNLKFDTPEAQEKIRSRVPVGRLTSADEMAEFAVFLCLPQSAYINGEVLTADGGAWLPRGFLDLK